MADTDPLADVLHPFIEYAAAEGATVLPAMQAARAAREHLLAEATECSECGNACTCGRDEPEIDCPIHGLTREQLWEDLDRVSREKTAAENEVERLRDVLRSIDSISRHGARTAHAADAFTQESRWLNVLALIEKGVSDG